MYLFSVLALLRYLYDCSVIHLAAEPDCHLLTHLMTLLTLWIPNTQQATRCSGLKGGNGTTDIMHGNYTKDNGDLHGSKATYVCDHGYKVDQEDNKITCDAPSANAAWPSSRPACVGTMIMFC